MLPTLDAIPVHDWQACMEMLEGDEELLEELLELFTENTRQTLEVLERAIQDRNAQAVRNAAHSIKGAAANLCAERVRLLAHELERAAVAENEEVFSAFLPALTREFGSFEEHVNRRG